MSSSREKIWREAFSMTPKFLAYAGYRLRGCQLVGPGKLQDQQIWGQGRSFCLDACENFLMEMSISGCKYGSGTGRETGDGD